VWKSGITVVTSAGNAGRSTHHPVPGDDPLVITVGAMDDLATASTTDDENERLQQRRADHARWLDQALIWSPRAALW